MNNKNIFEYMSALSVLFYFLFSSVFNLSNLYSLYITPTHLFTNHVSYPFTSLHSTPYNKRLSSSAHSMPSPVFSFSTMLLSYLLVKNDLLSLGKSLPTSWIKYHKWRMKQKQQQQLVKLIIWWCYPNWAIPHFFVFFRVFSFFFHLFGTSSTSFYLIS